MKSIIVYPRALWLDPLSRQKPGADRGSDPWAIQWVWEAASRTRLSEQVLVATDDEAGSRMSRRSSAPDVIMQPKKSHRSGTDRMAEVADKIPAQLYVNVQGDEPLLMPGAVDDLIRGMAESPRVPIGTLAHRIDKEAEWRSPEVVKVVCNRHGLEALYFSRSPPALPADVRQEGAVAYGMLSIYAFRPHGGWRRFLCR